LSLNAELVEGKGGDSSMNTNTSSTRSVINTPDREGKRQQLLVHTPHEKEVHPISCVGRTRLRKQGYHTKKIGEMSVSERVEYAQALKAQAAKAFASKDYKAAYMAYAGAVDAVQNATHMSDSSSDARVAVVMLIIRCSIKAARCSRKLEQWDEAEKFVTLEAEIAENIRQRLPVR
jgi:hypothetical protein